VTCNVRRAVVAWLAAALVCAVAAGCAPPKQVKVSGRVTLDGADLSEGDIVFVPNDASKRQEAGKIVGGRYEVSVWPGDHKVQISAARELPKKGEFAYFESIIPERYNEKTELTATVPPEGKQDVNFELKSDKKK
jgi:hypothetical protein